MLVTACLAAAAGIAGCGGSAGSRSVSGRAVFAQECASCHSLTGHDDPRHQGGDLRGFRASRAQLTQFAAEMPVRHALSAAQLSAVVSFVRASETRGG
jgi:mono/diheme cytochrome c family protein